jgi:hypothetical protein
MKTQVRVGRIIALFALVLYISKICTCLFTHSPAMVLVQYPKICYPFIAILFFFSSTIDKRFIKVFQCIIVFSLGVWSLCYSPRSDFFGLAIISISIVLLFAYGFVEKHYLIKCISVDVLLYIIFIFIPLMNTENKYVHALEWLAFIDIFLFMLWSISRDSIEKLRQKESVEREKYMRIIDEATSVARDAIKALDKIKLEEEKKGI